MYQNSAWNWKWSRGLTSSGDVVYWWCWPPFVSKSIWLMFGVVECHIEWVTRIQGIPGTLQYSYSIYWRRKSSLGGLQSASSARRFLPPGVRSAGPSIYRGPYRGHPDLSSTATGRKRVLVFPQLASCASQTPLIFEGPWGRKGKGKKISLTTKMSYSIMDDIIM